MRRSQQHEATGIVTVVLLGGAGAVPGHAQPVQIDTVVVTGTRAAGATQQSSMSAISVISADELARTGFSDVGRALAAAEPTLNLPHAATTASSANTRPITLLGMAPDQVLVLINGKRWHASAVLNFNNAVGRGSAPYDLNSLPLNAIQRVEVLRSGAAAQYGSDAIAGVVNIILKSNAQGGNAAVQLERADRGDGWGRVAQASAGLALGDGGHITVSGQAVARNPTNRAGVDERLMPPRVSFVVGDPRVRGGALSANASLPLGRDGELYATLIGTQRRSTSAAQYRLGTVSPLHPEGFVPRVTARIEDDTLIAGYRHALDTSTDLDVSYAGGRSRAAFSVAESANVSLGSASPTQFDGGSLRYGLHVWNVDLRRDLRGFLSGGNLAIGVEYREETYRIGNAPLESYQGGGAQGFPGLNPRIPVDQRRSASSAYTDLELKPMPWLTFGAALRFDHYQDFGDATSWKLSARSQLDASWALRGTLGTGFRAPALQQRYFSSVTSASSGGTLVNVGTFQVGDPVARALGASDLGPETSRHQSVGLVWVAGERVWLTADAYRIRVDDRIVLTDQLGGPAVQAALAAAGIADVQQAQFFSNAVDTTTRGVEAALNYAATAGATKVKLKSSVATFRTRLDRLQANPVLPALVLLGRRASLLLTEGQPRSKWANSIYWEHGPWSGVVTATRYGSYTGQPVTSVQTFGPKWLADLSLRRAIGPALALTAGVQNLGDAYPDRLIDTAFTRQGFLYGEESPFGVSGRSYFLRVEGQW